MNARAIDRPDARAYDLVMRYLLVAAVIGSALLPAAAEAGMPYVPLNVRPTVSLTVGQARMFTPAEAPTGAVIACVATGLRVVVTSPGR